MNKKISRKEFVTLTGTGMATVVFGNSLMAGSAKAATTPSHGTDAKTIHAKKLPAVEPIGKLEPVAYFNGAMQTGVTVSSQGRIFVNFPKWGDEVEFTVAEIRDGKAVAYDPRLIWPDTLSVAADGYLYVSANQLNRQARYQGGRDLRQKPYTLFRIRIDAQPVLLK